MVLATHPAFDTHDLTSIRYMLSGAAPLGEGLTKRVIARFEKHQKEKGRGVGVRIVQGYGYVLVDLTDSLGDSTD